MRIDFLRNFALDGTNVVEYPDKNLPLVKVVDTPAGLVPGWEWSLPDGALVRVERQGMEVARVGLLWEDPEYEGAMVVGDKALEVWFGGGMVVSGHLGYEGEEATLMSMLVTLSLGQGRLVNIKYDSQFGLTAGQRYGQGTEFEEMQAVQPPEGILEQVEGDFFAGLKVRVSLWEVPQLPELWQLGVSWGQQRARWAVLKDLTEMMPMLTGEEVVNQAWLVKQVSRLVLPGSPAT